MTVLRWPLHPKPLSGEALSSWIYRIASEYGQHPVEFLENEFNFCGLTDDVIDLMPPRELIEGLRQRTGFHEVDLRAMTLGGLIPCLGRGCSARNREERGSSLRSAISEDSGDLLLPGWHPWWGLDGLPVIRSCSECLRIAEVNFYRLAWRTPVLMSCPQHGLLLGRSTPISTRECIWLDHQAVDAPPSLRSMDQRSYIAIHRGSARFLGRAISRLKWFYLLRAIVGDLGKALRMQVESFSPSDPEDHSGESGSPANRVDPILRMLPHERRQLYMKEAAKVICILEGVACEQMQPSFALPAPCQQELRGLVRKLRRDPDAMYEDVSVATDVYAFMLIGRLDPQSAYQFHRFIDRR